MNASTTTIPTLTPENCIEAMQRFWREQIEARATSRGVALSLPLMYPDGWQVQVHIVAATPTRAIVTDRGQTLARLHENGLNLDAKETAALLEERKKMFELEQQGFELRKEVAIPLNGIDIQLFGEALVSIAHLFYRFESSLREETPSERALRQILSHRKLETTWNATIDGQLEKGIRVDALVHNPIRPFAFKIVKRRGPMLAYMEQWGWRWLDIHDQNPQILRGMVYDPDRQDWDATTLSIARRVCDLFCPYFETQTINDAIDKSLSAGN